MTSLGKVVAAVLVCLSAFFGLMAAGAEAKSSKPKFGEPQVMGGLSVKVQDVAFNDDGWKVYLVLTNNTKNDITKTIDINKLVVVDAKNNKLPLNMGNDTNGDQLKNLGAEISEWASSHNKPLTTSLQNLEKGDVVDVINKETNSTVASLEYPAWNVKVAKGESVVLPLIFDGSQEVKVKELRVPSLKPFALGK